MAIGDFEFLIDGLLLKGKNDEEILSILYSEYESDLVDRSSIYRNFYEVEQKHKKLILRIESLLQEKQSNDDIINVLNEEYSADYMTRQRILKNFDSFVDKASSQIF
jgi:hypothetical protein